MGPKGWHSSKSPRDISCGASHLVLPSDSAEVGFDLLTYSSARKPFTQDCGKKTLHRGVCYHGLPMCGARSLLAASVPRHALPCNTPIFCKHLKTKSTEKSSFSPTSKAIQYCQHKQEVLLGMPKQGGSAWISAVQH